MKLILSLDFSEIRMSDVPRVGGKNASLGELFAALKPQGAGVLGGFARFARFSRFITNLSGRRSGP